MAKFARVLASISAISAFALIVGCTSNDDLPPAPRTISGGQPDKAGTNPYGEANPHRKVGNPYKVAGIWYYPQVDQAYNKDGIASWYGPKFHGRKTANGEIFDMNRITAAHPTLPLPSIVRVTNLDNGRTIDVRVNDRGPFAHGRIIDLSRAAAEQLGYRSEGLARVKVEYLRDGSLDDAILALGEPEAWADGRLAVVTPEAAKQANPQYDTVKTRIATGPELKTVEPVVLTTELVNTNPGDIRASVIHAEQMVVETAVPAEGVANVSTMEPSRVAGRRATGISTTNYSEPAGSDGEYLVQIAAFSSRDNADRTVERFADQLPVRAKREERAGGQFIYLVRLGPFLTMQDADAAKSTAIRNGFSDARIVEF